MDDLLPFYSGMSFIIGALIFLILSRKRKTSDILLWTVFVIFHGLHEIMEYFVENLDLTDNNFIMAEKLEISLFAVSAVLLVIASLQRGNLTYPPWSYYVGLGLLFPILYFTWLPDGETFEGIHKSITLLFIKTGNYKLLISTNGHRLLLGLIFGLVPVIIFSILTKNLFRIVSQTENKKLKGRRNRTLIATIAAILFMISEGFEFGPSILFLKAFTALTILIIPVNLLMSQKIGLKSIVVFDNAGRMLYSHNFSRTISDKELNSFIIMSGFLSAIKTFSEEEIQQGGIKTLESQQGTILFAHNSGFTAGLISQYITVELEDVLQTFVNTFVSTFKESLKHDRVIDLEKFKKTDHIVQDNFLLFF